MDPVYNLEYKLYNPSHWVYFFVIDGQAQVGETTLKQRDALAIWEHSSVNVQSLEATRLLAIEVPLK